MIRKVDSSLLRGYYVKRLAEALGFKETDLARELGRPAGSATQPAEAAAQPAPFEEQIVLHLVLHGFASPARLLAEVPLEEFSDDRLRRALDAARRSEEQFGAVRLDTVVDPEQIEPEIAQIIAAMSVQTPEYDDPQQALDDCLRRLKLRRQRRSLSELEFRIRSAERAGDDALVKNLQEQSIALKRQILPRNAPTQTEFRAS
jgi:hypothetical protein